MTLPLAVTAAALAGGVAATYAYDRRTPIAWRIPDGLYIGFTGLAFVGFALGMQFGITRAVVVTSAALTAAPALLIVLHRPSRRLVVENVSALFQTASAARPRVNASTVFAAVGGLVGLALLWRVADRAMFVRADGIYTGVSHNIGDLPFHLTVMSRFVYGNNLPPEHPSFAGVGFSYTFLPDLAGSMLLAAGASDRAVIVWLTFAFCLAIAALLYRWTFELTASRTAAYLSVPIAFASGGLGWWRLVDEARDRGLWTILSSLPHDYTITADGAYRWGNLVTSLLVTQRSLLMGLPLALIVFRLWWESTGSADAEDRGNDARTRMIAAGLIAAMLPLVHAHSYAVVLMVGAGLAVLGPNRYVWVPFFTWALAIGLPQFWWLANLSGLQQKSFLAWSFGWDRGTRDALVFWVQNTGLFIPLLAAGLLWRGSPPAISSRLRRYYLPFALCFIVPNVLRLAPWIWDNIKVLIYWFVASVPIVACVLARMLEGRRWQRALAGGSIVVLMLAGALDLWRVASGAFGSRTYPRAGIEFAALVRERTSPHALIVHAPTYNHPVALSGRRSFMGYAGHVWSHGIDAGGRELDIQRMYAGGADATTLLGAHRIDYVVIGPDEQGLRIDESFFDRYPIVIERAGYRLYRIQDDRHQ